MVHDEDDNNGEMGRVHHELRLYKLFWDQLYEFNAFTLLVLLLMLTFTFSVSLQIPKIGLTWFATLLTYIFVLRLDRLRSCKVACNASLHPLALWLVIRGSCGKLIRMINLEGSIGSGFQIIFLHSWNLRVFGVLDWNCLKFIKMYSIGILNYAKKSGGIQIGF